MADFLAGQKLTALHFPPTVSNSQSGSFTSTNAAFGVGTTGGTYVDCGVAFIGCATGRAVVHFECEMTNGTAASATEIAPWVRTGGTVGAGTDIIVASISTKIRHIAHAAGSIQHFGRSLYVSGFTPGSTYNVRLEHRTSGGSTGTYVYRSVTVEPAT